MTWHAWVERGLRNREIGVLVVDDQEAIER